MQKLLKKLFKRNIFFLGSNGINKIQDGSNYLNPFIIIGASKFTNVSYKMEMEQYNNLSKSEIEKLIYFKAISNAPFADYDFKITSNDNLFNFWYWENEKIKKEIEPFKYKSENIFCISFLWDIEALGSDKTLKIDLLQNQDNKKAKEKVLIHKFNNDQCTEIVISFKGKHFASYYDKNKKGKSEKLFLMSINSLFQSFGLKIDNLDGVTLPKESEAKIDIEKRKNIIEKDKIWQYIIWISESVNKFFAILLLFVFSKVVFIYMAILFSTMEINFIKKSDVIYEQQNINQLNKIERTLTDASPLLYYDYFKILTKKNKLTLHETTFDMEFIQIEISGKDQDVVSFLNQLESKYYFKNIEPTFKSNSNITEIYMDVAKINYKILLNEIEANKND